MNPAQFRRSTPDQIILSVTNPLSTHALHKQPQENELKAGQARNSHPEHFKKKTLHSRNASYRFHVGLEEAMVRHVEQR